MGRAVTGYFKAMGVIFLTARKESFRYEQENTRLRRDVGLRIESISKNS